MLNSARFRELERRIAKAAIARDMPVGRFRRLVAFAVLIETLTEAVAQGLIPVFFVKGGIALELRLGLAARATKDLDIGFCLDSDQVLVGFDGAIAVGYGDFRLRRQGEAVLLDNGTRQLRVRIDYLGNAFATVNVDLAPASSETSTDDIEPYVLAEIGLTAARDVPCLGIIEQIAQKVHATTEPAPRGRTNARFRDVIDILLLAGTFEPNAAEIYAASARVFATRATHSWPLASYVFPVEWTEPLAVLAKESGYETTDIGLIQARFNAFLELLSSARASSVPSAH